MKRVLVVILCLLLTLTVACGEEKPSRTVEGSMVFAAENYPKVCVTPYTEQMGLNMAAAVIGCDIETAKTLLTVCETTDDCYEKLIKGECDIVIAHDYGESAKAVLGTTALKLTATELDRDALVFMTNGSQGVTSLTPEQLKSVYNGEVTAWSTLGGAEMAVTLFGGRKKTAVQNAFEKYISPEVTVPPVTRPIVTTDGEFAAEIGYDNRDGALGYTLLSVAGDFSGGSVKPLSINGVAPSKEAVQSGEYALAVPVNIVIRASEPAGSSVKVLYDWAISEQGRMALGKLY